MTGENTKLKVYRNIGLVVYSEEELQRILKLAEEATDVKGNEKFDFIGWILHDRDIKTDTTTKDPHYHILLKLAQEDKRNNKNITIKAAAKKLKVEENVIEILEYSYFSYHLKYLIHFQPKFHERGCYSKEEIQIVRNNTGKTLEDYLTEPEVKEKTNNIKPTSILDELKIKISKNEILYINQACDFIIEKTGDALLYLNNYKKIEGWINGMIKGRINPMIPKNMKVILLTGKTGTYKSTYANEFAKKYYNNFIYTAKANDLGDSYIGQTVFLINEYKSDFFDSLKEDEHLELLDNHSDGQIKSRYFNKNMNNVEILFLTTTYSIDRLTEEYEKRYPGNSAEFLRRISAYYVFTDDKIEKYRHPKNDMIGFELYKTEKNTLKDIYKEKIEEKNIEIQSILDLEV
jgi:hypothetical protein